MTRRERHRAHLTAEFVRSVLDYDPGTGIFRWRYRWDRLERWNTRYAGTVAGQLNNGYRCIQVEQDKAAYNAARLAWLYATGEWPVDQIDAIRDDNRWSNLRAASNSENNRNRGSQSNSTTGLRGVSRWGRYRWQARIMVDGKQAKIGVYDTPEEAAAAYREAAARLYGEFARR